MIRTGIGYDVHAFADDRKLILGGVEIAHDRGLTGHSDADVVCHAIADAILGAAALGDIGHHFPNTDPAYAGADSLRLLARVREILAGSGYALVNVDATLILEKPIIAPYVPRMRERLAGALGIGVASVSVKATTNEGLGTFGRGEGAGCFAVATITG